MVPYLNLSLVWFCFYLEPASELEKPQMLLSGYTCLRKQQNVVGADLGNEMFGAALLCVVWGIYLGWV